MATVYSDSQFRTIFQTPFNLSVWTDILRVFFKAKELKATPEAVATTDDATSGYYLGNIDTKDSYRIGLFHYEIRRGSVANKLVGLRNLVRTFINPNWGEFDAALVTFDSGDHWRLSFISDIKGEETHPKRYSYVFGNPGLRYNTPLERFELLKQEDISFSTLRKAFSVEALSDKFFEDYREHYADFVQYITGKRFVKTGNKWEEQVDINRQNDVKLYQAFGFNDKRVRDYVKKLMGRITFLHFLQRKGWMNGDLNYLQNLFERSTQKDNFLDAVLEPLFFGILNTKPEQRQKLFEEKNWNLSMLEEWRDIPYLNGGLFEQDEEDEPESIFPSELFNELFKFFGEYNFTIDENDPSDAEIGVDPEMLGKIFENLLEDNKDKGVFYTPKEVVQHMCQEALISYLIDNTHISESTIKSFIFCPEEQKSFLTSGQKDKILGALRTVKICDPAIGSGAFPMGLLNELVRCRSSLEEQIFSRAELKKSIINNNIYGVDIEKGAVDIARLRFWLAIVVDEKRATPLPNLDYKIMQGNSLVEAFNGVGLSSLTYSLKHKKDDYHPDFWESECEGWQKGIARYLEEYFSCSCHEKKNEIQEQIMRLVLKLLESKYTSEETIKELRNINIAANPYFFLWNTWFSDVFGRTGAKKGFDIVIGNPPYVDSEEMVKKMPFERELYSKIYSCTKGNWDLYIPFLEKAFSLLNMNGTMVLITPNKWLTIPYGKAIRKLLFKGIKAISDFSTFKVFESANVSTVSSLVKKKEAKQASITKFNQKYVKISEYIIDKKSIEIFDNLGLCLSDNVVLLQKLLKNPILSDSYITQGAATVSETYAIANILEEQEPDSVDNSYFKVINTGTISKFGTRWGESEMTYVKKKYISPVVNKKKLEQQFPKRYWQASAPKLVTKGIRYFEVVGDFEGSYLAAKSTVIIMPKGDNKLAPLLAILNSSVVFFFLKEAYSGLAMDGGITFTADNVGRIPIPKITDRQQKELTDLVCKYSKHFDENSQKELDELVYQIYSLNEKDIAIIENFKKSTKRKR